MKFDHYSPWFQTLLDKLASDLQEIHNEASNIEQQIARAIEFVQSFKEEKNEVRAKAYKNLYDGLNASYKQWLERDSRRALTPR